MQTLDTNYTTQDPASVGIFTTQKFFKGNSLGIDWNPRAYVRSPRTDGCPQVLTIAGRPLPEAVSMMMPSAWENDETVTGQPRQNHPSRSHDHDRNSSYWL